MSKRLAEIRKHLESSKIPIPYHDLVRALVDMAYTAGQLDQLEKHEKEFDELMEKTFS